jgi:hypothetical protein
MLDLTIKKKVKSHIELLFSKFLSESLQCLISHETIVKEAGKAIGDVEDNNVRYRHFLKYVLFPSTLRYLSC